MRDKILSKTIGGYFGDFKVIGVGMRICQCDEPVIAHNGALGQYCQCGGLI